MSTVRDEELQGAVQHALAHQGRLRRFDRVQVRVEGGVVELLGTVSSARERQAAEETARGVPGVTRVVDALTVSVDGERSDRELQAAVEQALARRPELEGNVGGRVDDGVVTLLGHITHPSQEALAIRVAGSVQGIKDVASALAVAERAAVAGQSPPDDPTLLGRVVDALAAANLTIFESQPELADGVVTLRGKVGSYAERRAAARAVANVDGLRAVQNQLVVQKQVSSTDADEVLAARVLRALREDGRVSTSAVMVEALGDLVYLYGFVNSPADQDAAAEVARRVPGVRQVVNDLLISNYQSGEQFVGPPPEEELLR